MHTHVAVGPCFVLVSYQISDCGLAINLVTKLDLYFGLTLIASDLNSERPVFCTI